MTFLWFLFFQNTFKTYFKIVFNVKQTFKVKKEMNCRQASGNFNWCRTRDWSENLLNRIFFVSSIFNWYSCKLGNAWWIANNFYEPCTLYIKLRFVKNCQKEKCTEYKCNIGSFSCGYYILVQRKEKQRILGV